MKKLLTTLLLTFFSINAVAGWTEFGGSSSDGSVKIYYDKVTTRNHDHVARIWRIKDYMKPQASNNTTYLSEKSLLEVNCKTKMRRTMAYTLYKQNMGGGESVLKNSNPAEWEYIAPDITGEAARRLYCGKE
ncbi:surface-adhesin E family protein [Methylotenera sp. L2L1]|uniref:surface-adhesin E family protein n=1 Tax=Methylotenera sp. L2L1 TaxID=1502770 RepID=UPI00056A74D0|nr:surface-adhesin E family protein [Methylotenera sp. L2L1]